MYLPFQLHFGAEFPSLRRCLGSPRLHLGDAYTQRRAARKQVSEAIGFMG